MVANEKSIQKLNKNLSTYLNDSQLEQVNKAYLYAVSAHSGQFRSSGDPVSYTHLTLPTSPKV